MLISLLHLLHTNKTSRDHSKNYKKKIAFLYKCDIFKCSFDFFLNFSPLAVRHINDQLMLFERAFLDPQGLPGRPYAR